MNEAEAQMRLEASVSGLADRVPLVSARSLFTPGQRKGVIGVLVAVVIGLALNALLTIAAIIAVFTLGYLITVLYRAYLFTRSSKTEALEIVTDEEALIISDSELPSYTIMIPAYNEASVIVKLVENVAQLDYPVDRLEVLILVEEDDLATLSALRTANAPPQFRLVLIPPAQPRTKPKALNFGLTLAQGDIVAVYDVEDAPDILQLRRAAVALGRYGPEVGCVQAQLTYSNATQNIITKWFTIEYAMWFSFFLPGLSSMGAPIPLGGTSNHFRRSALRELGGWDAYNVTEDCDLGIRMFREHYQIKVLESVTLEEANSDFVNWVKQRSRWYKGYLQTSLIHLRSPRQLVKEIGTKGVLHLCAFVGATPILAALNPFFWLLTIIWFVAQPEFVKAIFPAPVYYVSLALWAFGNFLMWYLAVLTARHTRPEGLMLAALLVPVYWVMMSVAALKAMWQLVITPSFWEKTTHGLGRGADADPSTEEPEPLRLVS
jgi:cellulose synthase/poly-beta-1,6-N-acetylglucosamine synthase-like glycosyltransferase